MREQVVADDVDQRGDRGRHSSAVLGSRSVVTVEPHRSNSGQVGVSQNSPGRRDSANLELSKKCRLAIAIECFTAPKGGIPMSLITWEGDELIQAVTSRQARARLGFLGTVEGKPLPPDHRGQVSLWLWGPQRPDHHYLAGDWATRMQAKREASLSPVVQFAHMLWQETLVMQDDGRSDSRRLDWRAFLGRLLTAASVLTRVWDLLSGWFSAIRQEAPLPTSSDARPA